MRSTNVVLMVAGLALITACDSKRDPVAGQGGGTNDLSGMEETADGYADTRGEVHEFRFGPGREGDRPDFEAGPVMRAQVIMPAETFRGVTVMLTAPRADLEYRVVFADGETTDWMQFSPDMSHDKFHNGTVGLDQPAEQLHFRSIYPIEYVRFEFFEQTVETPDIHDDARPQ
ncbi:MAG: hypothetical protein ACQER6_08965 [Pseudomonadota bacterium]